MKMSAYKISDNFNGVAGSKVISPHHSHPTNGVRPSDSYERKKDVAGVLRKYRDLGEDAWSHTEPCSDFAIAIWKAATGEDLSTGLILDTPTDLKNTIFKMNGGRQCPCIKYLE